MHLRIIIYLALSYVATCVTQLDYNHLIYCSLIYKLPLHTIQYYMYTYVPKFDFREHPHVTLYMHCTLEYFFVMKIIILV